MTEYIRLKQHCILIDIRKSLYQMVSRSKSGKKSKFEIKWFLWNKFMRYNLRYSSLYEEMADYNRFWSSYITFIFVFYLLLMAYIVYGFLFGDSSIFTFYVLLFLLNATLLGSIIFICGAVVHRHVQQSQQLVSLVSRFKVNHSKYIRNILKVKLVTYL